MMRWLKHWLRRWWYRNVYLRSWHWQTFRQKALAYYGHRCQVRRCVRSWPMDVHHKTYARRGHERLSDVTLLCRFHHNLLEHGASLPLRDGTILKK